MTSPGSDGGLQGGTGGELSLGIPVSMENERVKVQKELMLALADRYRIDEKIGEGTMATVYLAHDLRHQRTVALKVLRRDTLVPASDVRFVREIRMVARLQHPHILPLLDSGRAGGHLYYVMPHVRGESLRARLDREGRLAIPDAIRIARQVSGALDYAHRHGVIHRDVKPENILLAGSNAHVVDFGIARNVGPDVGSQLTSASSIGPGTPSYMAPEQLIPGHELDGRCDIYALGIMLYEMLTGEVPFRDETGCVDNKLKLTAEPPKASALRKVPKSVDRLLARALQCMPENRYSSAGELAAALPPLDGTPSGSVPVQTTTHESLVSSLRARPAIVAAGIAGTLLLIAAVVILAR